MPGWLSGYLRVSSLQPVSGCSLKVYRCAAFGAGTNDVARTAAMPCAECKAAWSLLCMAAMHLVLLMSRLGQTPNCVHDKAEASSLIRHHIMHEQTWKDPASCGHTCSSCIYQSTIL